MKRISKAVLERELEVQGRTLSVTPARTTLADRLAASPKSPARWTRDPALEEDTVGREVL